MVEAKGAAPRRRGPRFGTRQAGGRSKFGNVKVTVDGIKFDSQREARRYQQLQLEVRAGQVRDLKLQVAFPIHMTTPRGSRVPVAKYIADFTYWRLQSDGDWLFIVEDAKGHQDKVFRLKRKLVEAEHGIEILLS